MNKIELHQEICNRLHEIYKQKNEAYGDSFGDTYKKLGPISAVTRITDKHNRLVNLVTNPDINIGDESINDTLLDMANYCIMTVIEQECKYNPQKGLPMWIVGDDDE